MTVVRRAAVYYTLGAIAMALVMIVFGAIAVLAHGQGPNAMRLLRDNPLATVRDVAIALAGGAIFIGAFVALIVEVTLRNLGPYHLRFDGSRWRVTRTR
jgi:hypothetical protein